MFTPALMLVALASSPAVPAVAVSDFTSHGASPELALALGGVAGNELSRLGAFRVQTADATRVLLGVERQRQLMGCGESCGSVDLSSLQAFDYLDAPPARVANPNVPTPFSRTLEELSIPSAAQVAQAVKGLVA